MGFSRLKLEKMFVGGAGPHWEFTMLPQTHNRMAREPASFNAPNLQDKLTPLNTMES